MKKKTTGTRTSPQSVSRQVDAKSSASPPLDRTKIFPEDYVIGKIWSKILHDAHFKIVAANRDNFDEAYTVALRNPAGWMAFAHRNVFGDVNHLTLWPPNSTRMFEVYSEKDMDEVFFRVLGEKIKGKGGE